MSGTKRINLLIADDNDIDVILIRRALDGAGLDYDADVARDGKKALALIGLSEESPARAFGGMILDLNLVTHSGLDILAKVRASPLLAETPVVILTSSSSPVDRRKADALGVAGYIAKPMDLVAYMEVGKQIAALFMQHASKQDP